MRRVNFAHLTYMIMRSLNIRSRDRCTAAILLARAACAPPAVAGEADPARSGYRLNVPRSAEFRLAGAADPARGAKTRAAIPAQLAGKPFAKDIHNAAHQAALDPALVHAVIDVESRYNPAARSPKGALGLMQVMPATGQRYGVPNPARSVEANLSAGTQYLRDLMTLFDGRLDLVLAAYNAGENAVLRYGMRIPPYRETREYVPAVLSRYRDLQGPPAPRGPARIEYLPGTRLDPESVRAALAR